MSLWGHFGIIADFKWTVRVTRYCSYRAHGLIDSLPMGHDGGGLEHGTLIKVRYEFSCEEGPGGLFEVLRMRATEGVDEPYELDLELVCEDLAADTDL